jgi:hypothetical protein
MWSAPISIGTNVPIQSTVPSGFFLLPITDNLFSSPLKTYVSLIDTTLLTSEVYSYTNDSNEDVSFEVPKNGVV